MNVVISVAVSERELNIQAWSFREEIWIGGAHLGGVRNEVVNQIPPDLMKKIKTFREIEQEVRVPEKSFVFMEEPR